MERTLMTPSAAPRVSFFCSDQIRPITEQKYMYSNKELICLIATTTVWYLCGQVHRPVHFQESLHQQQPQIWHL